MSKQIWEEPIAWATADGTAVANTTTETAIFPAPTIPANYLADGRTLRLYAAGKLSTTGTPTIGFVIRYGAAVSGVNLFTSELITTATGSTNTNWSVSAVLTLRSNGSSGTIFCMGDVCVNLTASTATRLTTSISGFDAPAVSAACDLTTATVLTLAAVWSAASASNTLTGNIYLLEAVN